MQDGPVTIERPHVTVDTSGPGEDKLLEMAAAMDRGEDPKFEAAPEPTPTAATPEAAKPGEKAPEPPKPDEKSKAQRDRDKATGKFVKAPEKPAGEQPPTETAFARAVKEEERQKNLLANFEKNKQELRQREEQIAERERQLNLAAEQQRPRATLHGYTADEYLEAAKDFAANGDFKNALKARDAAGQIQAFEFQHFQQQEAAATDAAFRADMEACIKENEALADQDSPIAKVVQTLLEEYPEAYYLKNGFSRIAKIAQKLVDAESVPELKKQINKLTKDLADARESLTPAAGGPSAPLTGAKSIAEMGEKEGLAHLERLADEADRQAA